MTNLLVGGDVTLLAIFTDLFAETQRKEPPGEATGIEIRLSNEVVVAFLSAVVRITVLLVIVVVVIAVVVIAVVIVFVYHYNKLAASCSGAERL